jgi:predicted aminopeptidase
VKTRAALLGLVALSAGCASPLYVARVGWNEARILLARQPIAEVIARPDVDPGLKSRLELVLAVRAFAGERLGLRVGDSYRTYAEVDGRAQVWVLSGARRDKLESYTWWYPIVGRVPYRGFFSRAEAEAAGQALAAKDLDVDVRPAVAFSTLGWFADPLLSTTAAEQPVALVETVVHELFHATLWHPGAIAFNESAATFVGYRGAAAFFCAGPSPDVELCAATRRQWTAIRARGRVLGRLKSRLVRLYASGPPPSTRERIRAWLAGAAARALEKHHLGGRGELVPPNNARLLGELIYLSELDVLDALAPTDADVGTAVATLVERTRGAKDPFAAARAAVVHTEGRTLDSGA